MFVDTAIHFKATGEQVVIVAPAPGKRGLPMESLLVHHALHQWVFVLRRIIISL